MLLLVSRFFKIYTILIFFYVIIGSEKIVFESIKEAVHAAPVSRCWGMLSQRGPVRHLDYLNVIRDLMYCLCCRIKTVNNYEIQNNS